MTKIYRIVIQLSWLVGLLSLLAAIILKTVPPLAERVETNPRGALEFSIALFLCAMATRAIQRATD
jgi:hypothetical protein